MERTFLGLESVAIIFSLPYALLMWGYVLIDVIRAPKALTIFKYDLFHRSILQSMLDGHKLFHPDDS